MATPVKLYQKEMHSNLGFFATWFPGDQIALGDIGVLENGRFRKWTSLGELGIRFKLSPTGPERTVQYTSASETKLEISGGAATPLNVAKAEIKIGFSREGAFLFHASGLRDQAIENRPAVAESIEDAYGRGRWKKEWYLVEALYSASAATIVVSEDHSAELVLSASGDVPLGPVPLADPRIGLTISSTRGRIFHVVGGRDLHPLYTCLRLEIRLIGAPSVVPVRGPGERPLSLARPSIDDLLES